MPVGAGAKAVTSGSNAAVPARPAPERCCVLGNVRSEALYTTNN